MAGDEDGSGDLSAPKLRELFLMVCRALSCDALRLKPREKQFCLLLALESFCAGSDSGEVGVRRPVRGVAQADYWCQRLSDWRPSEIWEMLQMWRRAGWVAVDEAEGRFRLAPDRLPGWADVIRLLVNERQQPVDLQSDEDLNKTVAKFSQANARKSQPQHAKFSQPSSCYNRDGDVLEISKLETRVPRVAVELGTRLEGQEKARFEQRATDSAQTVASRYRHDGYLAEKLAGRRRLSEELCGGKTPTARKFAVLYATKPDRAREMLGEAIAHHPDNPAASLNVRLQNEGVRY